MSQKIQMMFFSILKQTSLFIIIIISWRLITLQHCSCFCHTLTWISHGFTCVPHCKSWEESLVYITTWTVRARFPLPMFSFSHIFSYICVCVCVYLSCLSHIYFPFLLYIFPYIYFLSLKSKTTKTSFYNSQKLFPMNKDSDISALAT